MMYAPRSPLSLNQNLQQQFMDLPQILELLRQSPEIPLECLSPDF